MINAIPRTRVKNKFGRPEVDLLDKLRTTFFAELEVPVEEKPVEQAQQLGLFDK